MVWTGAAAPRGSWRGVASSSDGISLAACASGGSIFTSADGGVLWTDRAFSGRWTSIVSSADGTRLAACVCQLNSVDGPYEAGDIYTSPDGGTSWFDQKGAGQKYWRFIASSSDARRIVACIDSGGIYAGQ